MGNLSVTSKILSSAVAVGAAVTLAVDVAEVAKKNELGDLAPGAPNREIVQEQHTSLANLRFGSLCVLPLVSFGAVSSMVRDEGRNKSSNDGA